ncbi:MAG: YwaF family protein [Bacilli bacterium]|nr:YwaF family protein [Bacilli bacterium]
MTIYNNIFDVLGYELSSAPKPYGPFHLGAVLITLILAIIISVRFRHANERINRIIVLSIVGVLIGFEIYKQLIFSYNDGTWVYQWYAFPFQFCSVPMYVGLIAGLLKPGKVRNATYSFLGTFCLFAGLAVMVYPNDVFTQTLGISIQTMVHHGGMVILGVYMIVSNRAIPTQKGIIGSGIIFIILVVMAQSMNLIFAKQGINMFFISPTIGCHLPVLSIILSKFGYTVFIITYILGFIFVAYLILNISIMIKRLIHHYENKRALHSLVEPTHV